MAENNQMTASTTKHDRRWSGKKMERDNGLNTLESLRGRLLAERQASRVAKEEAESLGNKFVELEKKLREEIKLRDKGQRKLQFLKKKLESFNISFPIGQSEHSHSSEKCENSRGSSSCSSSSTHSEEAKETKPHRTNPTLSENAVHNHNAAEASALIQKNHNNSDPGQILCKDPNQSSENLRNDDDRLSRSSSKLSEKHCNSEGNDDCRSNPNPSHDSLENICHNQNPSNEDLKNDESRLSSLSPKSSVIENEDGDFVDNSLALVPLTLPTTSQATNNHKPVHESVLDALDALRRAREGLLCAMGTRPMIKFGPT